MTLSKQLMNLSCAILVALGGAGCNGKVFQAILADDNKGMLMLAFLNPDPAIAQVRSLSADGSYGAGSGIDVTLAFNKSVTLSGGTLDVTLNTGKTISIPAFGPASTVSATYPVAAGETTSGAVLNVSGIALNGGTIQDTDGKPMTLFTIPEKSNLADLNLITVDGVVPVISSISSTTSDGAYGAGSDIDVTVNFSKPVTLTGGTLDLTLDTGDIVSVSSVAGSAAASGTYRVPAGKNSAKLNVTGAALSGGTLTDTVAFNPNAADITLPASNFTANKNISVDTTAPVITAITSSSANGSYGGGSNINVTLSFSEPVTLTGGTLDVTLNSINGVTPVVLQIPASAIDNTATVTGTYTVASGDTTTGADMTVSGIAVSGGGSLHDVLTANMNTADTAIPAWTGASPSGNLANNNHLVVDGVRPAIVSVTSINPNMTYGIGTSIDLVINFSKPVTLTGGTLDVMLKSGKTLNLTSGNFSAIPSQTATVTYSVSEGESTSSAKLTVTGAALSGGATLRDGVANNPNNATLTGPWDMDIVDPSTHVQKDIKVDGIRPVITSVISTSGSNEYGAGSGINITVNFSEDVNLAGGSLDLTLNSLNGVTPHVAQIFTISGVPSASMTYTVLSGDTTSGADLVVTGIANTPNPPSDSAGNQMNVFTFPAGQNITNNSIAPKNIKIKGTSPSITSITSTKGNGRYGIGETINITVNFSANVDLVGGDLNVTLDSGAVVSIPPFVNSNTASATYTVAGGQNSTDLSATGVALSAGSMYETGFPGNQVPMTLPGAGNNFNGKDIAIDTTPPAILSVTSLSANGTYKLGSTVNVTVNFSEPVTLAGGLLNVTLDTGDVVSVSAGAYPASTLTGTYAVGAGDISTDLNASSPLALTAGSVVDTASVPNTMTDFSIPGGQSIADNKAIVIDGVQPTITGITSTGADDVYGEGSTINVRVQFSEAVTLAGGGTFDVTLNSVNGATPIAVNFAAGDFSGTMANKTVTVNPNDTTSGAKLTATGVSLSGATLVDAAGNNAALSLPVGQNIADLKNIKVDGIKPVITSVTSSTADGTYGTGGIINVTVNFSEPVTLSGGALQVTLDTGDVVSVSAGGGYPAAQLTGTYTVGAGDTSADLNAATPLTLTAGSIVDTCTISPNTMTDFSIPAGQSIASGKAIVIDGVLPVITLISSSTPSGTYGSASLVNIRIDFSKPVTLAGVNGLLLTLNSTNGGTPVTVAVPAFGPATFVNYTYTIGTGDTTSLADLNVTGVNLGVGSTLRDSVANSPNNANLALPAANLADDADSKLKIDGVLPAITAIDSTTTDGTYGAGANVNVRLTFNKAVTLAGGGTLDVTLDTGETFSIGSIAGVSVVDGTYTVGAEKTSADLNVNSIVLNGATLRDSVPNNPNNANLSLPGGQNLANNRALVIDSVAPVISSITSTKANGRYGAGTDINVTLNFSKAVTLSAGTLDVTLDTGSVVSISPISGATSASGTYTVPAGKNSADLNVTNVALNGGTLKDGVANSPNNANLALPAGNLAVNKAIVVDTTAPTITSVTSTSGNGLYGTGTSLNVTVNFSEPVILSGGNLDVTLNQTNGGVPKVVSIAPFGAASSGQQSYTVVLNDTTSAADLTAASIALSGGTLRDACDANANSLTDFSIPGGQNLADLKNIVVNGIGANVSSVTSSKADGRYGAATSVNVTVNFSTSVDLVGGTLDVTLDTGAVISIGAFSGTTASGTYTVAGGQNSSRLSATNIVLNGGTLVTTVGSNPVTLTLPGDNFSSKNIIIDTTAPTITSVTSSTADGSYGFGSTVNVAVNFSEPVTLSGGALNVTLSTGTVVSVSAGVYPASQLSGTYTVSAGQTSADLDSNSPLALTGSIVDACNENPNALAGLAIPGGQNMAALKAIVIDGVEPTVSSITSSTGNGTYGTGSSVNVTVNFSKNVTLSAGNLNVTLDTGAVIAIAPFTNSNTASGTYSVASGQNSADLNVTNLALSAGTLRDTVVNNPNTVNLALPGGNNLADNKNLVIDAIAPAITSITSSSADGSYGAGAGVNITINFNRSVTLAGGTLDVTLNSGQILHVSPFGPSNPASFTYTVIAGDSSSDLDATAIVLGSGATLKDAYNNDANLALPASGLAVNKAIVIDAVAPVISSITSSSSNGSYGIGGSIDVTINFSKNVTLSAGTLDVTLDTGAVVSISPITNVSTASGTYTVSSGQNSADLNVTGIAANGGTLKDTVTTDPNGANLALPGGNNLANNKNIAVDGVRPTIASVTSMTSNGTYVSADTVNVTVTFSETVTLSGGTLDVALNSGYTLHIPAFGTAGSASGTYTVAAGNTTSGGSLTASSVGVTGGTIVDGAANALTVFTVPGGQNIADSKAIVIDGVLPAIVSAETQDLDGNGRIDHYKITFNKAVKDSTFPGYSANNLGTAQTDWLVAGYTGVVLDHGTHMFGTYGITDTPNDTVIYLKFNEISTGHDTAVKPDLTTTLTPALRDNAGSTGNPMSQALTSDVVETDKAAPVIVASSGVTGSTAMAVTFSEPVDPNGSAGGCATNFTGTDLTYVNDSGGGAASISSMGADVTACDDNKVTITLNTALTAADLSPTPDHVHGATNALRDMNDNYVSDTRTVAVTGAISPYILGVTATGARKIKVTYSEPVVNGTGPTGAQLLANYTLIESPVQSGCSGGSDTVNLTGTVTEITPNTVFELSTDADQCPTTTYKITVANVVDVNDGVALTSPNYGTFLGNERLKVSTASCLTTSSMLVVFNKTVLAGTGNNGAESMARYKFTGPNSLGSISTATRGSGGNDNQVTLAHSIIQTGATYTVIGANTQTGDGFDETSISGTASFRPIKTADLAESLQDSPRDRSPWVGCGTEVTDIGQGPITTDPFGDATTFGYLASYAGKVYIGPNRYGNAANRMEPNGANPVNVYFSFAQDTSGSSCADGFGSDISCNTATSRDGGTPVPPYVTIGHTGCTVDTANISTGCGPDNEDGRGVFHSGTLNSTEYILMGGARSGENFNYLYYSSSTGTTLNFNYIDMGTITGTATQGLSSLFITGSRIFSGMAKTQGASHLNNSPDFGKINFASGSGEGDCTPGNNCDASSGTNGARFRIDRMDYFGGGSQSGGDNTSPNWAWMVGVDSLYVFNNVIYAGNGGHNATNHNGAIIRSTASAGTNPGVCTAASTCPDWTGTTPSNSAWYNTNTRYSIELTKIADLIPADKAIPGFATFNNNLYMIRNSCNVTASGSNYDGAAHTTAGCTDGTYNNRQPQLWKCVPGANNTCESGEWSLVATSGGVTNMGVSANHSLTMIVTNGSRLYIAFDSLSGVQVWRTKDTVTNPTVADSSQWEQVGTTGLCDTVANPGCETNLQQIYSGLSIQQGSNYNLYISVGKDLTPMSVFRQLNQ